MVNYAQLTAYSQDYPTGVSEQFLLQEIPQTLGG